MMTVAEFVLNAIVRNAGGELRLPATALTALGTPGEVAMLSLDRDADEWVIRLEAPPAVPNHPGAERVQ